MQSASLAYTVTGVLCIFLAVLCVRFAVADWYFELSSQASDVEKAATHIETSLNWRPRHAPSLDRLGAIRLTNAIETSNPDSFVAARTSHSEALLVRRRWPYSHVNIAIALSSEHPLPEEFGEHVRLAHKHGRYERITAYDLMVLLTNNFDSLDESLKEIGMEVTATSLAMKANRPLAIREQLLNTRVFDEFCRWRGKSDATRVEICD